MGEFLLEGAQPEPEETPDREFAARLEVWGGDQRVVVCAAGLALFVAWQDSPWPPLVIGGYLVVSVLAAIATRRWPRVVAETPLGPALMLMDLLLVAGFAQAWGATSRPLLWLNVPIVLGWTLSARRSLGRVALVASLLAAAWVLLAEHFPALRGARGIDDAGGSLPNLAYAFGCMALSLVATHRLVEGVVVRWQTHAQRASELLTERRVREREQELASQLEASMRLESLGRLAGGIAHDFNNVLTGLTGLAELAQSEVEHDPKRAQEALDKLLDKTQRASDITAKLLDYARRRPREPVDTDVVELVEDWQPLIEKLLGTRGRLELETPGRGACWLRIDPGELQRAMFNLATNARDAIEDQGTLRIVVRRSDDTVQIEVQDDGTGIAAEHLPHIFEPFFTGKAMGESTGLGLSGVYGIVRRSGGQVDVSSQPGEGTSFRLTWPAAAGPKGRPSSSTAQPKKTACESVKTPGQDHPPAGPVPEAPLLVVDDDEAIRLVARAQLEAAGFTVELADGPQSARASMARHPPNHFRMLITDVVMPGTSGVELASEFASHAPGAPVLLMSGYPDDVLAAATQQRWSMLEKPFTAQQMVQAVRQALL